MSAVVGVHRKSEVGLIVPGQFIAATKNLRAAIVLWNKVLKQKNKHFHFELSFDDYQNSK